MNEEESLGEYLKREREAKKISLREMAKNTRVREHLLKAIEEDRLDLLPSPTYVRGFLLAYAKYIKADPQDVFLRFERLIKVEPAIRVEEGSTRKVKSPPKKAWLVAAVAALGLVASYFLYPYLSAPPGQPDAVKSEPGETRPLPPATEVLEISSIPGGKPFSLDLKANEETWVKVQVNGQPPQEALFKPGEGGSYQAEKIIEMVIGNAGGLDMSFNGGKLERFGKSGEVVTLIITPQGVEKRGPDKSKTE